MNVSRVERLGDRVRVETDVSTLRVVGVFGAPGSLSVHRSTPPARGKQRLGRPDADG